MFVPQNQLFLRLKNITSKKEFFICIKKEVKMNSRDRVKAAICHKEPDRAPIDFGAMRSTGISIVAYSKLRNEMSKKWFTKNV